LVPRGQKTQARQDVGRRECDSLQQRTLRRAMGHDEAFARVRPYLRRQVAYHTLHRLIDRPPLARSEVRTLPVDAPREAGVDVVVA